MTVTNLSPTIVLVDELGNNDKTAKLWLETKGYNVREVDEIYDVLEEVTDITLEQRPQMILLHSRLSDQDCSWVVNSLSEVLGEQNISIVSFSNIKNGEFLTKSNVNLVEVESFDSLKPLMQTILPFQRQTSAAA